MYASLVSIHLIGAALTGVVAASAGVALSRGRQNLYKVHATVLGALAGFEILTGVALSIASPEVTALSLCANVALYLSVVFAVEALLFIRMKQGALAFPASLAFAPSFASLVVMFGAISAGV
jgi:hypothetical protein